MDFSRLKQLSREIDFLNALILKDKSATFNSFFENEPDLTEEFKLNKICEMIYKVLKSVEVKDIEESSIFLKDRLEEYLDNDSVTAHAFIEFIKMNIEKSNINIENRIEQLLSLNFDRVTMCQLKIDYLQLVLSLLLNQAVLNIELINQLNDNLKSVMLKYDE